jgi:hypothetical protein
MIENINEEQDDKLFWNVIRILKSLSDTDDHIVEYFKAETGKEITCVKRCKLIKYENYMVMKDRNRN